MLIACNSLHFLRNYVLMLIYFFYCNIFYAKFASGDLFKCNSLVTQVLIWSYFLLHIVSVLLKDFQKFRKSHDNYTTVVLVSLKCELSGLQSFLAISTHAKVKKSIFLKCSPGQDMCLRCTPETYAGHQTTLWPPNKPF